MHGGVLDPPVLPRIRPPAQNVGPDFACSKNFLLDPRLSRTGKIWFGLYRCGRFTGATSTRTRQETGTGLDRKGPRWRGGVRANSCSARETFDIRF